MHRVPILIYFASCLALTRAFFVPSLRESAAKGVTPFRRRLETKAIVTDLLPTTLTAIGSNSDVATLFSIATFGPQPFWLLMILAPDWTVTKKVMGSWSPLIALSLIHLAVVVISATQTDGTAPIKEFADVFDATGFPFSDKPQQAMIGMMTYPNFVAEEWPHVLIWDLFVGRLIWLDGLERGVFTPHSVLLCNLIGPPGLMLHFATCLFTGAGLPPLSASLAAEEE